MEKKRKNFDENYAELVEFCKRENRLPYNGYGKNETRLAGFMKNYKNDPRIIEIKEKYSRKGNSFDENLQDLIEFCEKENRLPQSSYGKEEGRLKGFMKNYKNDPRIIEIKEKYSRKGNSFDENLQDLIEFCKRENRLPQSKFGKEEGRLKGFIQRNESDPTIIEIKEYYCSRSHFGGGKSKFEENLKDLIEFCERENRLPHTNTTCGKEEDSRLGGFIWRYKDDPRIIAIKRKYFRNKSFNENLQDLIEFCERENKLPSYNHHNRRIEDGRLMSFMQRYKDDPKVMIIKKKYSKRGA